jgi:hypothetical protein
VDEVKNDKGVFENRFNKVSPTQKKFFLHTPLRFLLREIASKLFMVTSWTCSYPYGPGVLEILWVSNALFQNARPPP